MSHQTDGKNLHQEAEHSPEQEWVREAHTDAAGARFFHAHKILPLI